MLTRSQRTTIVFRRPFVLKGLDRPQLAGTYDVETEEELLEGLSFTAYRRVLTTMTPQSHAPGTVMQALLVDPAELEKAQAATGVSSASLRQHVPTDPQEADMTMSTAGFAAFVSDLRFRLSVVACDLALIVMITLIYATVGFGPLWGACVSARITCSPRGATTC